MSYVRVESSVPLHPKFLKAGAAASWLWLCGLAHCQEALTDGFIADEALAFLGVPKPRPLAAVLVAVQLWHKVDGGWQVHNYLQHNNSAEHIRRVRADRKEAGRRGGRPRKLPALTQVNLFAFTLLKQAANQNENPATATATTVQAATASAVLEEPEKQERATAPASPVENPERLERLNQRIRQHRRRRSNETDDGKPAARVITALAKNVLRSHPCESDDGELRELLKAACARANLRYDSTAVGTALEQARAQLRRAGA